MKAYLYTWGEPRFTHEGERVPAKIEDLDIGFIDGMLLLPLVEEHNIDERSPLCGHTHESLMAVSSSLPISHSILLCRHTLYAAHSLSWLAVDRSDLPCMYLADYEPKWAFFTTCHCCTALHCRLVAS